MSDGRGLSRIFMDALKEGQPLGLHSFLHAVRTDHTLDLEIRENYLNIYYRGGNLICLEEIHGKYTASFDRKYIRSEATTKLPPCINKRQPLLSPADVQTWIDSIPLIKQEMDTYFTQNPANEREAQQLMVRENNFGDAAPGTDYFICDIEYATPLGRFDLVAVHWPSSSAQRKNNHNLGLALMEMKYMDKSLSNASGLCAHVQDLARYFHLSPDNFSLLKQEMQTVFNQKWELGLIANQKPIAGFDVLPPQVVLVLANHDPASRILLHELQAIQELALPFQPHFAVSTFWGYGLYDQNVYPLQEFLDRFSTQIYAIG